MIPNFGMGTFRLSGPSLTDLVSEAIEMGYPRDIRRSIPRSSMITRQMLVKHSARRNLTMCL